MAANAFGSAIDFWNSEQRIHPGLERAVGRAAIAIRGLSRAGQWACGPVLVPVVAGWEAPSPVAAGGAVPMMTSTNRR